MTQIIAIEDLKGPFQEEFQQIMKIIPEKDKGDKLLQRLIAFRLKLDGEALTKDYLVNKIEEIIQCNYTGSLYTFLKDDLKEKECLSDKPNPAPPDVA